MRRHLSKALREVLESTIDAAAVKKQLLQADLEDRLNRMETEESVATADLIALFRIVNYIQRQDASINADRYSLLRY